METFTCLAAKESTAMASKGYSMMSGSALRVPRWILTEPAPPLAHGPSWEAQLLVTPAAPTALKALRAEYREVGGQRQRPQTPPGTFGFLAARAWTPPGQLVC